MLRTLPLPLFILKISTLVALLALKIAKYRRKPKG